MLVNKFRKGWQIIGRRLPLVSYNFLYSLLPGIFSVVVSYVIVRESGLGIWGEYVYVSSVVSFLVLVAQFGIKDQLLREFSFNPSAMIQTWYQQITLRLILLSAVFIACFLLFDRETARICSMWLILLWLGRIIEVFFIYHKRFKVLLLSEILYWGVSIILIVFNFYHLSLQMLLQAAVVGTFFKVLILFFDLRKLIFPVPAFNFSWKFPTGGLTFFVLALTGLLEARADIFCIKFILGNESVGKYSLIFNFLLLLKNIPDFFVSPFLKNFYRSGQKIYNKVEFQLGFAGVLISITGVLTFRLLFEWIYKLHYSWFFYGIAILYVFPRFLFSMDIYRLFQQKKEYIMVVFTLLGLLINVLLNFLWLKQYGIESVIISACLAQFGMLLFFKLNKKVYSE